MATQSTPPAGYHTVTPMIVVRDAPRALEFYKRAFDAKEVEKMLGPGGKVMHAEIEIGDSRIMLGEENPEWGSKSPESTNGTPGSLYIYVADADKSFARAVDAGAKVRAPLEDAFWGDRFGKITDPFGHEWGIATRVRNLSSEEMQRAGKKWMEDMQKQPA